MSKKDIKVPLKAPARGRGRPKGLRNISSYRLKEELKSRGFEWIDEFMSVYMMLNSEKKMEALCKILPFLAPKYTEIKVNASLDDPRVQELRQQSDQVFLKLISSKTIEAKPKDE